MKQIRARRLPSHEGRRWICWICSPPLARRSCRRRWWRRSCRIRLPFGCYLTLSGGCQSHGNISSPGSGDCWADSRTVRAWPGRQGFCPASGGPGAWPHIMWVLVTSRRIRRREKLDVAQILKFNWIRVRNWHYTPQQSLHLFAGQLEENWLSAYIKAPYPFSVRFLPPSNSPWCDRVVCCQYPLNAWRLGQARIGLRELRVGKSNLFLAIQCNVSAPRIKSILYFLSDFMANM